MSALRDAADRIARMGRHPTSPDERLLALERACTRLGERAGGSARQLEEWDDFLRRIGVIE